GDRRSRATYDRPPSELVFYRVVRPTADTALPGSSFWCDPPPMRLLSARIGSKCCLSSSDDGSACRPIPRCRDTFPPTSSNGSRPESGSCRIPVPQPRFQSCGGSLPESDPAARPAPDSRKGADTPRSVDSVPQLAAPGIPDE